MLAEPAQQLMDFVPFRDMMNEHFKTVMDDNELYEVDVSKEEMWDTYLNSFPPGTNPIFRERTEHDCSCCRTFIRDLGNVVAIHDEKVITIWEIDNLEEPYHTVAQKMDELIRSKPIRSVFYHYQNKVGTHHNREDMGDHIHTWNHFYCELNNRHVVHKAALATKRGHETSLKEVTLRSLREITVDAVETVLDLIKQGSLYRGEEHRTKVSSFLTFKRYFDTLAADKKELFAWSIQNSNAAIRNTVIGTLLVDLSEGVDLDTAVTSFEQKVAPTNYKRPKALITPKMVRAAEKKVKELGLTDSLPRRHAKVSDLTINAVHWADRSVKREMSVFDEMAQQAHTTQKDLSKVEKVSIKHFIQEILPNTTSLEVMMENQHVSNLMSLLAPVYPDAKPLFHWDSNFSWTYNGEVADSIKERVKAAGGTVTGLMRASLAWFNYDDLDIHVQTPAGDHIYYGNKSTKHGELDVDMNAGSGKSRNAVENVTWGTKSNLQEGRYRIWVNNFQKRETEDIGFTVELEYGGVIHTFHYNKDVPDNGNVVVAEFDFTYKEGIKFRKSLQSTAAPRTEWEITTTKFTPVRMVLNSPNYWGEQGIGNHHFFFILDGCRNPDSVRGFFNEYLRSDLTDHRKVFETLGAKMKAPYDEEQLSGLGFSSTQRNELICRVKGTFNRTVKVQF